MQHRLEEYEVFISDEVDRETEALQRAETEQGDEEAEGGIIDGSADESMIDVEVVVS